MPRAALLWLTRGHIWKIYRGMPGNNGHIVCGTGALIWFPIYEKQNHRDKRNKAKIGREHASPIIHFYDYFLDPGVLGRGFGQKSGTAPTRVPSRGSAPVKTQSRGRAYTARLRPVVFTFNSLLSKERSVRQRTKMSSWFILFLCLALFRSRLYNNQSYFDCFILQALISAIQHKALKFASQGLAHHPIPSRLSFGPRTGTLMFMKGLYKYIAVFSLIFPAAVHAQYTYTTNFPDTNTITITDYRGAGGSVHIPSNISEKAVTCIGDSAFYRPPM